MIYLQPGPAHLLEIAALPRLEMWLSEGKNIIVHAEADCFKNSVLQNFKDKYMAQIIFYSYPKKNSIKRFFLIAKQIKKIIKEYNIDESYLHNFVYFENRLFIYLYHKKPGNSKIFISPGLKQDKNLVSDFKLRSYDYIYKSSTGQFRRRIWRYCSQCINEFLSEYLFPFIYTLRLLPSDVNLRTGELRPYRGDRFDLQFLCYSSWDESVLRSHGITNIVSAKHPACRKNMLSFQVETIDVIFFFTRGMVQYLMARGYSLNKAIEMYFIKEIELLNDISPGLKIGVRLHPNEFYKDEILNMIQQNFEGIVTLNEERHTALDTIHCSKVIITDGCSISYLAGVLKKQLVISINHLKLPTFSESFHYDGVTYSDTVEKTSELYHNIPTVINQNFNS